MLETHGNLVNEVNAFLTGADRKFLTTLSSLDRGDQVGQSTIRYLMRLGHWPFTPDSKFAELMEHFFGEYPEKERVEPETYQNSTFEIIKECWGYECVPIIIEPKPAVEQKLNPGKRSKRPRMEPESEYVDDLEGESGSKQFKSLNELNETDIKNASTRLKKVIAIQRSNS